MKLNDAYYFMGTFKAVMVILALILIICGWYAKLYCYTFEMDYSGPGSEYERSMEHYQDEENRQAAERGEDNEKAEQYRDDHGV